VVKKIIWYSIGFFLLILFAFTANGCCTYKQQPVIIDTGGIATLETGIDDYERRLREYGSIIRAYDGITVDTVERIRDIRERADKITDRIDRVIFLFEEYDREVSKLLDAYNRIRSQYKIGE
jgi:hypothetical protein